MTQVVDREALHEPTVLERMRRIVKEKKKPKLKEFAFIISEFAPTTVLEKQKYSFLKRVEG